MILQALVEYYENLLEQGKVAKAGWCQAKVSHMIEVNENGTIKGIIPLKQEEDRGKKKVLTAQPRSVPEMVIRSSGISANFLCDNAKYLLGIDANGTKPRIMDCFLAAKDKHVSILDNGKGVMAKAVCAYFRNWNPENAKENPILKEYWEELNEGGNIIFGMRALEAQDDDEIKALWEEARNAESNEQQGICLVTGQKTDISRIHKGIKGVPGAQSSGAALVSFNAPAFESYGKEQSYNAPVGKYAEFAYTTALNYLLGQREYRFPLGDSIIVFWAESGKEEYQKTFMSLMNPQADNQEEMKKLFGNLQKGIRVDLMENLSKHYQRMEIIKPAWVELEYLGIQKMLFETVNQKSKDKTPIPGMAAMVLNAVLQNDRYPVTLYTDTLIRIRSEQGNITCGRAAIIKAVLMKNYNWKEGEKFMGLNEECKETAYVLGRLFAVLEFIQRDANPGINATIRDRYFNSACATPASVFPILIKLKNSHMKKIERESAGTKVYYEKLLTELMGKIEISENSQGFPNRFSLEEQGKFMLGYYHQVQKRYEKKEEK